MANNAQMKTYANFNNATFQGRIFNADLVETKDGSSFLAVTVITNPSDDSEGITVTFNNNNGLRSLHASGWLPNGRQVTVTGHIASVSETYEKNGELIMRQRPQIHLVEASIPTGGLGPMPADKQGVARAAKGTVVRKQSVPSGAPSVDQTPAYGQGEAAINAAEELGLNLEELAAAPY